MWESELEKPSQELPLYDNSRGHKLEDSGCWIHPMDVFCLVYMVFKSWKTEHKYGSFCFKLQLLSSLSHRWVSNPPCANNWLELSCTAPLRVRQALSRLPQSLPSPDTKYQLPFITELILRLFHDKQIIIMSLWIVWEQN